MKKRGFTLIELMVVMAIIAVLALLIIGAIIIARRTSLESVHRGNARTIQTGLEAYYAKNKAYPAAATYDFEDLEGTLSVTLSDTGECTGTDALGGGTAVITADGYTLTPYNYECDGALGASDVITVN